MEYKLKTPAKKNAQRRADIPKSYRQNYDRAISGKSKAAAIKAACLECMGWQRKEVELCTSRACPLFPYRPYIMRQTPENQGVKAAESTNTAKG